MGKLQEGRTLSRQGDRIAARYRQERRRIDRLVRECERRSPQAAERRARIRAATRAGKSAIKSRDQAESRLVDALKRLVADGLSIRESAERVGASYYEARSLIRAADVADAVQDQGVGGQV
jgi:molybdenum-dependent DNA-binding transcriptional regulator ModE